MTTPFALCFFGVYGPILELLITHRLSVWTVEFFLPQMVFVADPLLVIDLDAETREVLTVQPVSGSNAEGALPVPNFQDSDDSVAQDGRTEKRREPP